MISEEKKVNKQSKEQLAKLMAMENIVVDHNSNHSTANFDTNSRVLGLPMWDNITDTLYDCMVGHEVGHALETPNLEPIIEKIVKEIDPNNAKGVHSFINVVEDARIERLMKIRYPGLKYSFVVGYQELLDKDFFSTKNNDVNTYSLIDRLNLHFKLSSASFIKFIKEEKPFIKMMEETKTFNDVIKVVKLLYEYCKKNNTLSRNFSSDMINFLEKEKPGNNEKVKKIINNNKDSAKEEEEKNEFGVDNNKDSSFDNNDDKQSDSTGDNSCDSAKEEEENTDKTTEKNKTVTRGNSLNPDLGEKNPISKTDSAWEYKKQFLANKTSAEKYETLNYPNNIHKHYKDFCIFAKQTNIIFESLVQKSVGNSTEINGISERCKNYISNFKTKHRNIISYMVKEFEMRKSANLYQRAKITKTGVLNTIKLYSYKFNDDLFRRITNIPNGKNHGLIMIIDWSGSMERHIANTLEQALLLTMFCKRAGIKFKIFCFSDGKLRSNLDNKNKLIYDDYKTNEMLIENVALLELVNSNMGMNEYKKSLSNIAYLINMFRNKYNYKGQQKPFPVLYDFYLNGTPLNQAIILSEGIIEDFRKEQNVQIVTTIFLTDGDSNVGIRKISTNAGTHVSSRFILIDRKTNNRFSTNSQNYNITTALLEMLKERVKCKILGFYILNGSLSRGNLNDIIESKQQNMLSNTDLEKAQKEKSLVLTNNVGYDEYYIVPGAEHLKVDENEEKDFKIGSLSTAVRRFSSHLKNKIVNKVLLNKFVSSISSY